MEVTDSFDAASLEDKASYHRFKGWTPRRGDREWKLREGDADSFDFALLIDADSDGSRLLIYQFPKRIFRVKLNHAKTLFSPLKTQTLPIRSQWTRRITPTLFSLTNSSHHEIRSHLAPLLAFAQSSLQDYRSTWADCRLFLHATLTSTAELDLLKRIRQVLWDKDFNPFAFKSRYVKLISPEEHAAHIWSAVKFGRGLQARIEGVAPNSTSFAAFNLETFSTQLAMEAPNVLSSSCRLGSHQDWNGFCGSLSLGTKNTWDILRNESSEMKANSCMPPLKSDSSKAYHYYTSPYSRRLVPDNYTYSCEGVVGAILSDRVILPAPFIEGGEVIGTGEIPEIWDIMKLDSGANYLDIEAQRKRVCSMSISDLQESRFRFNSKSSTTIMGLREYCFRVTLITQMLEKLGFDDDRFSFRSMDYVGQFHVAWPLGSILNEINRLPWELQTTPTKPTTSDFSWQDSEQAATTHSNDDDYQTLPQRLWGYKDHGSRHHQVVVVDWYEWTVLVLLASLLVIVTVLGIASLFQRRRSDSSPSYSRLGPESSLLGAPRFGRRGYGTEMETKSVRFRGEDSFRSDSPNFSESVFTYHD